MRSDLRTAAIWTARNRHANKSGLEARGPKRNKSGRDRPRSKAARSNQLRRSGAGGVFWLVEGGFNLGDQAVGFEAQLHATAQLAADHVFEKP